jgi:hypothetical protein
MNDILDLIDFERRGEYVLADVKFATWFFECRRKRRRFWFSAEKRRNAGV